MEVESHFLFWACPSREFFFHLWTYPAHPTTLFKKNSHLPRSSTYVMDFFFQNSLSFCCHCHCCCCKLKEWCHRSLLLLMLREELGVATTSRCEQHKVQHLQEDTKTRYVFYIFSLHLRFLYIFSLGLGL